MLPGCSVQQACIIQHECRCELRPIPLYVCYVSSQRMRSPYPKMEIRMAGTPPSREELSKRKQKLGAERDRIAKELGEVETLLEAWNAFDTVASRGQSSTRRQTRQPRKGDARQTRKGNGRGGRSGIREQVLELVSNTTEGMSASAVFEALQATEKTAKTSARNALAALKKGGKLVLENGTYKASQAA